jgi:hypothetical protein
MSDTTGTRYLERGSRARSGGVQIGRLDVRRVLAADVDIISRRILGKVIWTVISILERIVGEDVQVSKAGDGDGDRHGK